MSESGLSVVLPCYNEEETLEDTFNSIRDELAKFCEDFEIIIVEDGCSDSTPRIASKLAEENSFVKHLHFENRLGKGRALEKGFKSANGDKLFFMDTDLATDLKHVQTVYRELDENEVVIGSRYLEDSNTDRDFARNILSRGYNFAAGKAFSTGISDHQCGFKGFKSEAFEEISGDVESDHWFWDTEALIRAEGKGFSVKEIPVEWEEKEGSEISIQNSIFHFSKKLAEEKFGEAGKIVDGEVFSKFLAVGILGMIADNIVLYTLHSQLGLHALLSKAVSAESSIVLMFLLNDNWTFKENNVNSVFRRFLRSNSVRIAGVAVAAAIFYTLYSLGINLIISNVIGIGIGFMFNYLFENLWTWEKAKISEVKKELWT